MADDRMRILLVEDEQTIAVTLTDDLEGAGYEVKHFPDGKEAIDELQRRSYDVVITDGRLPGADGLQVLQAAAQSADVVFVTDDNPRTEDPALIRAMVREGCPEAIEVADRAEAILRGVDALEPGDALLIAGKGHETGQTIGDDVLPFDDAEQASIAVAALDGVM